MRPIDADALLEEMGAGCVPICEEGISEVTGDAEDGGQQGKELEA